MSQPLLPAARGTGLAERAEGAQLLDFAVVGAEQVAEHHVGVFAEAWCRAAGRAGVDGRRAVVGRRAHHRVLQRDTRRHSCWTSDQ